MNPFVAMGVQAVGSFLGGKKRAGAAREQQRMVIGMADDAVKAAVLDLQDNRVQATADQARAAAMRADDEARLAAATGYDFKKLRDDAIAAGFNPLTALQATGGAGYDGRGAVLTTPFIATPESNIREAFYNRTAAVAGTGQAIVDNAGYFGDALSGLGSNLIGLSADQAQQMHELRMQEAYLRGATTARTATGDRTSSGRGSVMGSDMVSLSPIRTEEILPVNNAAGYFKINNPLTYGDIYMPGDSEPWGLDELTTAVIFGTPQVIANRGRSVIGDQGTSKTADQTIKDAWGWLRTPGNLARTVGNSPFGSGGKDIRAPELRGRPTVADQWQSIKGWAFPAPSPQRSWTTGANGMLQLQ